MLFKQEDLNRYDPIQEAADILNESVYLDESESTINSYTIPIVENKRLGINVVNFRDIDMISSIHGIDYITAMQSIAESNEISMDELAVSVPEWKIIADPEVVNELNNVVVTSMNSNHPIYRFVEACIDTAIKEDYSLLENIDKIFTEDSVLLEILDTQEKVDKLKAAIAARDSAKENKQIKKEQKLLDKLKAAYKNHGKDDAEGIRMKEQIAKHEKKIQEMMPSTKGKNGQYKSYSRIYRRMADDKRFGFEKDERIDLRARARQDEDIKNREIGKRKAKAQELENAKPFVQKILSKIKNSTPAKYIAQAISSLKSKYQSIKQNMDNTAPENRTIVQRVLSLILSAIDKLSNMFKKKNEEENSNSNTSSSSNTNDNRNETKNTGNVPLLAMAH